MGGLRFDKVGVISNTSTKSNKGWLQFLFIAYQMISLLDWKKVSEAGSD